MMTVADRATYRRYREARSAHGRRLAALREGCLLILLFGGIGAITWAIRGTGGWDGVDGTLVPGLTWGVLWYYICRRKGIDATGIPLWLGLGIALGGELGYGQYVSWIQGKFHVGDEIIAVAPWIGYAWFVICGIGWGAPGGIALGWALGGRAPLRVWLVRLLMPLGVALLARLLIQAWPWLVFPNWGLGIYNGELGKHLDRTVYTNSQNATVVAWWIGAMLVAAAQKDRFTLVAGAFVGGGFGIGFVLSALWCLGYVHAPRYIDWWKMWELNAGFNLGLLYVLTLCWAVRQVDKAYGPDGTPVETSGATALPTRVSEWGTSFFWALGVFAFLAFTFLDNAPSMGVWLGGFYVLAVLPATWQAARTGAPGAMSERRKRISLTFSVFLLLFVTLGGATYNVGGLLALYDLKTVGQYAWPPERIALFRPIAAVIIAATLFKMWQDVSRASSPRSFELGRLPERMVDLLAGLAVVGAATIWPAKIGVLYALFLFVALFGFTRLNRRFDEIDTRACASQVRS